MFRSYDHHQVEKYITTLGLLNLQRIRCLIRSHITVIVYYAAYRWDLAVKGDVFSSVCTFCVPLWPEASLSMQLGLQPKCGFS
jgi:hypothetical protein